MHTVNRRPTGCPIQNDLYRTRSNTSSINTIVTVTPSHSVSAPMPARVRGVTYDDSSLSYASGLHLVSANSIRLCLRPSFVIVFACMVTYYAAHVELSYVGHVTRLVLPATSRRNCARS